MTNSARDLGSRLLHVRLDKLTAAEQTVLRRIADRGRVSRNINREFEEGLSFGQRLADRVASFGGSWTFILAFAATLIVWIVLNSWLLLRSGHAFDPFPYILLNLVLSMLAAIQAPVILMSQNRQVAKDRMDAAHDYEVNLKAELEILELQRKMDECQQAWEALLQAQQDQTALLRRLLDGPAPDGAAPES